MNVMDAIKERKSVRNFQDKVIPKEIIEEILQAGMEAPSTKNSQPWRYYVTQGKAKDELVAKMKEGVYSFGPKEVVESLPFYPWVMNTIRIMEMAPVVILVFNTGANTLETGANLEAKFMDCGAMQNIGATVQNMLLAATDRGLGSLWICDVFYAYNHICSWLHESAQLAAAVALGYEKGNAKKATRQPLEDHAIYLLDV